MEGLRKRLFIIAALAITVLSVSLYNYWQKSHVRETAAAGESEESMLPVYPAANSSGSVIVYISGAVVQPGVVSVPADARVIDVVNAAGGLAQGASVSQVNMAQAVKDGMHIKIPGDTPARRAAPKLAGADSTNNNNKININTANEKELDKLPGIGPALAGRIVEYRTANGPFKDIADLKKVSGIGANKFEKLKDKVTL